GGLSEAEWRPCPRLAWGQALRGIASACIDTSDGVIPAVDQLARVNDVAVHVETPQTHWLDPHAAAIAEKAAIPRAVFLAGPHGELELVFTVPPERLAELERVAGQLSWTPLRVGTIAA